MSSVHSFVGDPPMPDTLFQSLLERLFGSPSLVVSTFVLLNFLWTWWSLARDTVGTASVLLDRSYDWFGRGSFKVRAAARTAMVWSGFYLAASFVTQIWAGSQYSPGQGGGFKELVQWSALFGAIAVVGCLYLVPSRGAKDAGHDWGPAFGLLGGYLLGMIWAVVAFTAKNGPSPGDWWVCPAMSCIGILGSALRFRIGVIRSWKKTSLV
jgi:hypothetical protein